MKIPIREAGSRSVADCDLDRRVQRFLKAMRPELAAVEVIAVDEGLVQLEGAVSSYYLRQLAVAGAKRCAGVRHVVDDIVVTSCGDELQSPVVAPGKKENLFSESQ